MSSKKFTSCAELRYVENFVIDSDSDVPEQNSSTYVFR